MAFVLVMRFVLCTVIVAVVARASTPHCILITGDFSCVGIRSPADTDTTASSSLDSFRRPLWKMLQNSEHDTEFVGPFAQSRFGESLHAADFNTRHACIWDLTADALKDRGLLGVWANLYNPRIVVVSVGNLDLRGVGMNATEVRTEADKVRVATARIEAVVSEVLNLGPTTLAIVLTLLPTSPDDAAAMEANKWLLSSKFGASLPSDARARLFVANAWRHFDAAKHLTPLQIPNAAGEAVLAAAVFTELMEIMSLLNTFAVGTFEVLVAFGSMAAASVGIVLVFAFGSRRRAKAQKDARSLGAAPNKHNSNDVTPQRSSSKKLRSLVTREDSGDITPGGSQHPRARDVISPVDSIRSGGHPPLPPVKIA